MKIREFKHFIYFAGGKYYKIYYGIVHDCAYTIKSKFSEISADYNETYHKYRNKC